MARAKLWAENEIWWNGAGSAQVPDDGTADAGYVIDDIQAERTVYTLRLNAVSDAGPSPWRQQVTKD